MCSGEILDAAGSGPHEAGEVGLFRWRWQGQDGDCKIGALDQSVGQKQMQGFHTRTWWITVSPNYEKAVCNLKWRKMAYERYDVRYRSSVAFIRPPYNAIVPHTLQGGFAEILLP
jgi:hypothetical protein